jgi:pimeloyl-ACP methyl ester carboxylesterase
MTAHQPTSLTVTTNGAERRIATLLYRPQKPTGTTGVVWLPGLKSDMTSTKASALAAWAEQFAIACTRLDYSGHGQSSGRFEDGTIGAWLDDVDAVVTTLTSGPQVLVGSSTGGYLALLLLRRYLQQSPAAAARIRALVLVAPAWDLTTALMWDRFPESARRAITENGVYMRPSNYGDGAYAITRAFIEEGKAHLIGPAGYNPGRPVYVLHGLQDEDVPWEHTLDLVSIMSGDHVEVDAIPEGDHRLSTPDDIARLLATVERAIG